LILLHRIDNPFQPQISRKTREVEWHAGMTLAEILRAAEVRTERYAAVVDGFVVPAEMLEGFTVSDGAQIVAMPNVGGGSFGKMFAEIAVMVAAAAITAGIGGIGVAAADGLYSTFGINISYATMNSVLGAAVALGGNMLINAFMGPHAAGGPDSAAFDPTGPKTVASGGTPIPKGYGSFLSGGNIIASYVEAEGESNYLNVLLSLGWGPAISVSDVSINGNSIQNYNDATYMVRYGTNNQTPIPYFNNIVNGYPQNARVIADGITDIDGTVGAPVVINGTGTQTQGLQVVIQFPDGVFYSNDDGSLRSLSIAYKIEYAIEGSGNWQTPIVPNPTDTTDVVRFSDDGQVESYPGWVVVPNTGQYSSGCVYAYDNNMSPTAHTPGDPWTGTQTVTYYNPDGSSYQGSITLTGEWQPCDPNLNQQVVNSWYGGWIIFSDANQGTLYHQTNIYNLPPAKYDVRVTKYGSAFSGDAIQPREADNSRTGDQVWIHSIGEVQYQDLAYPNEVLVGIRALATDQLSGANIQITAQCEYGIDTALPAELASYELSNPAVVLYDMLVNSMYGGGIDPDCIDVPAFAEWAAYCDEPVSDGFGGTIPRASFNGVFDQNGTNLWKQAQKVASLGYAMLVQRGQIYTIIIDQAVTVPAQIFTSANVLKDSIKDTWVSLDDRANRIEATFADAARTYRTDEPCAVMLPGDIQAGVEQKPTRLQLLGCTNRAQAWHWCYRKLLSTDTLLLQRSIGVGIESVACQVGDVIGIQDDVAQWANGGRIQAGSTTTALNIDVDSLTFAAGAGWTVSIVHPLVTRGTGTISSITGNLVQFAANIPSGRIVTIENAAGAVGAVQATGANTVTVESIAGFGVGQTVTFYDQDVIDTQPVSAVNGTVITPAEPFLQTPTEDCPWVYGQSAGAFPAKLFTVTNIKRKGDFSVTLDTLEYDPSIYSDDTPIIEGTLGVPDSDAAVSSLTATEQYVMASAANGGVASIIALGWQNGPNTTAVQLWVSRNEANQPISSPSLVLTVTKGTTATLTYPTGTILTIRAVGIDGQGMAAPFASAPTVTITVQGSGQAPGDVTSFTGNYQVTQTNFSWTAPSGASTYEIRYNDDPTNTNWQAATLLWAGSGTTWSDSTIRSGVYLIKALSAAPNDVESINAASFSLQSSTSYLNALGLAPNQSIAESVTTNSYSSTSGLCTVTLSFPTQTLSRTDTSTVTLAAQELTWTNLQPATTYYIYPRLRLSDMTMHSVAGDPPAIPDTAINLANALLAAADGYYQGTPITVTTPNTSDSGGTVGGSGGEQGICPDGRELVIVKGRGEVPVSTVVEGDQILGRTGDADGWKRVIGVRRAIAQSWYLVNGYRISPHHPVWIDGKWQRPYEVGSFDPGAGERVKVTTDETSYDEQNYYLVGRGERLLIHNYRIEGS